MPLHASLLLTVSRCRWSTVWLSLWNLNTCVNMHANGERYQWAPGSQAAHNDIYPHSIKKGKNEKVESTWETCKHTHTSTAETDCHREAVVTADFMLGALTHCINASLFKTSWTKVRRKRERKMERSSRKGKIISSKVGTIQVPCFCLHFTASQHSFNDFPKKRVN